MGEVATGGIWNMPSELKTRRIGENVDPCLLPVEKLRIGTPTVESIKQLRRELKTKG